MPIHLSRLKPYSGLLLGLAALLLRVLYGFFPFLCEYSYSRGFFLLIRWLIDHSIALLPFAGVYLLFVLLLFAALWGVYKTIKTSKGRSWRQWWSNLGRNTANFAGAVIFFFLVLWGYNYARIPFEEQIGLEVKPLSNEQLRAEADYISMACSQERFSVLPNDSSALSDIHFPADLESEMRRCLVEVLEEYGFPTIGAVRGRQLYPKGLLYGFGSSGVYIPFTGEGHIEPGLHILQKPFTLAHEMAHGYGFGDEGICNFLGFLACLRSSLPAVRYSGLLAYWRYVFGELRDSDPQYYKEKRPLIDRGMYHDLAAIYAEADKYKEFVPGMHEVTYEAYLQMQGVKEGLQSYDRLVLMVVAWKEKKF